MSSKNQLGSPSPQEEAQDPRQVWQSAYAGADFLGTKAYLILLAQRDDPTKMIYATLEMGRRGVHIDVPLEEHTPEEELRQSANLHPTLWGGIDPEGYREATETYTRERLLAFLNKAATAAGTPANVPARFYDILRISHGEAYGSVHVSSHGGSHEHGYNFNATLEPWSREFRDDLTYATEDVQMEQAIGFADLVQASLPHVIVTPLPVDTYIQDVQTTLSFLPRV